MNKISAVICAGLVSLALGACKKDEKGGEGGAAKAGEPDCAALGKRTTEQGLKRLPADAPADMKKMAEEMSKKAGDVVAKVCKEDKWSKEAIACGMKAEDPEKECGKLVPEASTKKLNDEMEKLMGEMMGSMGAMPKDEDKPEPTAAADQPAGGEGGAANTGIAECDAYVGAMDKYLACDKVPQEARDGAKAGLDAMKSGWGDMAGMPEEAKKAAADGCKQAVDALKQAASAMGCEI